MKTAILFGTAVSLARTATTAAPPSRAFSSPAAPASAAPAAGGRRLDDAPSRKSVLPVLRKVQCVVPPKRRKERSRNTAGVAH